eukprot:11615916-Ditylum_brightwellii.AAC.1
MRATPEEVQKRCDIANLHIASEVHACMSACDDYLYYCNNRPYACSAFELEWKVYSPICKIAFEDMDKDDNIVPKNLWNCCAI